MQRFDSSAPRLPLSPRRRSVLRALTGLVLAAGLTACGSTDLRVSPGAGTDANPDAWSTYAVTQGGLGKKMRFREAASGATITMGYKGIPVGWGSPINLLVDERIYSESFHRARYRFRHPFTRQTLVLEARAGSQRVAGLPIRRGEAAPRMDVVTLEDEEHLGGLAYDFHADVLIEGDLTGHRVEIEKLDGREVVDGGLLDHLLFPFPLTGRYAIRVDGRELGRFRQEPAHGFQRPYRLELTGAADEGRDAALLAFIAFDRMREFVESAD